MRMGLLSLGKCAAQISGRSASTSLIFRRMNSIGFFRFDTLFSCSAIHIGGGVLLFKRAKRNSYTMEPFAQLGRCDCPRTAPSRNSLELRQTVVRRAPPRYLIK